MINNTSTKPGAGSASHGYQGREMDEKARKDREDKQRKLVLQKRALELKEMDLRTQESKYSELRREITKLESQPKSSVTTNPGIILQIKNLERQNIAKIAEDQKKLKSLEQGAVGFGHVNESNTATLIAKKEQEEKQDSKHIAEIKEEIRRKTSELKMTEDEDRKLQQEIIQLKNQPKGFGEKEKIEQLKNEIFRLNQNLETEKQQIEKTNKDSIEDQKNLLQNKTQEAVLTVNRINGIKDDIKLIQNIIQTLER
jgi:hypothetical protein